MKTIYIITILLLIGAIDLCSQTSGKNYVRERIYTGTASTSYLDVIHYYDNYGRLEQTVQKGVTPARGDLITLHEYDNTGRQIYSWLPASGTGNNGAYMAPSNIKGLAIVTNGNDQKPYSRQDYEQSPLNRVVKQFGAGADWQNKDKAVRTQYLPNAVTGETACMRFSVTGTSSNPTLVKNSNYAAGQLHVIKTTDEDGNISYEFKDKLGQVVLTRQKNGSELLDTYYVYDNWGNLCFVLPPRGADIIISSGVNATQLNLWCYQYKYDERNRCIYKKMPGVEPVYYVYDKADRLIFSQDGEQRAKGEWAFSIPDHLGREAITGICKNVLNYTTDPLKSAVVKASRANATNTYKGYGSPAGVTLTNPVILSVNYYDDYAFIGYNGIPSAGAAYNAESGYATRYTGGYRGLLTGTLTAQMNPDGNISATYLYKVMYYDNKGRVIQIKSNNHLAGGLESEYIAYNFSGEPTSRKHVLIASGKPTQTELYTYTYDHAGRMLTTKHKLNTSPEETITTNTYDNLGRLYTQQKGTYANLKTTYGYNVRGWTKSISSPIFKEELYYNESYNGNTPAYNGNISAMTTQIESEHQRRYNFRYDNLSRLTAAIFSTPNSQLGSYNTAYTYDKHGNITALTRHSSVSSTTTKVIDQLAYTYNGNQVTSIKDTGVNVSSFGSEDFKDHSKGNGQYTYNRNGALNKDTHKGISSIQYNFLNLPRQMDIKSPVAEARNQYLYSAGGQKLRVTQKWNPNYSTAPVIGSAVNASALTLTQTTDYVGNKVYENSTLKRIHIPGGYIENSTYYYYQSDHLGSNRVTASSGYSDQKVHYYPFGSLQGGAYWGEMQPYKYNGKELDKMHGLNLYDYSARYYDATIGRFTTVDPHAENYYSWSPYAYVGNNPIIRIDPTGMDWYFNEESGGLYYSRDVTDEIIKIGGQDFIRVGGNDMMGDMGDITKKMFDTDASRELASANGYAINPIQQVKESRRTKISDIHNPTTRVETPEQQIVINEKYSLMSIDNKHQVKDNTKTEILGNKFGAKEFLKAIAGATDIIVYTREYSNYYNSSDFRNSGKEEVSAPAYGSRKVYNTWQEYYRETKGKGDLLKFRQR